MLIQDFSHLGLPGEILDAVRKQGYTVPTEIQNKSIPFLLDGRDLVGTAQTGTGKTAAFVLPLLDRLMKNGAPYAEGKGQRDAVAGGKKNGTERTGRPAVARPRALILAPTRELAVQIDESVTQYSGRSGIRHTVIYGGAPKPTQAARLRALPDILVATPGRLMDFIGERLIDLSSVQALVLDEADRMLDMGFIPVVREIAALTSGRSQTVLFSATMPREVEALSRELLVNPERISVSPRQATVPAIRQSVFHLSHEDKSKMLPVLIRDRGMFRVIVFTRTKHRASRLAQALLKEGIPSDAIHGDRTQNQRQRALDRFRSGRIQVLVATDVASRGIDVDDISHVINFEIPNEPESYVHRIGRTGRAGKEGDAISFCEPGELADFRAIEKLLGQPVPVDRDHPYHVEPARPVKQAKPARQAKTAKPFKPAKPAGRFGEYRPKENYRPKGETRKTKAGEGQFKTGGGQFRTGTDKSGRSWSGRP